jgi:hypothetical protein
VTEKRVKNREKCRTMAVTGEKSYACNDTIGISSTGGGGILSAWKHPPLTWLCFVRRLIEKIIKRRYASLPVVIVRI